MGLVPAHRGELGQIARMGLQPVLRRIVAQHVDVTAFVRHHPEPPVRVVLLAAFVGPQREAAVLTEPDVGQPVRPVGIAHPERNVVQRRPPLRARPYASGQ